MFLFFFYLKQSSDINVVKLLIHGKTDKANTEKYFKKLCPQISTGIYRYVCIWITITCKARGPGQKHTEYMLLTKSKEGYLSLLDLKINK